MLFQHFRGVSEGLTFFNLESGAGHQICDLRLLAGVESVGDGGPRSSESWEIVEPNQKRRQDAGGTKSEKCEAAGNAVG
jgi:hypothetical protein